VDDDDDDCAWKSVASPKRKRGGRKDGDRLLMRIICGRPVVLFIGIQDIA